MNVSYKISRTSDNGGSRSGTKRRQFTIKGYTPERRSGNDMRLICEYAARTEFLLYNSGLQYHFLIISRNPKGLRLFYFGACCMRCLKYSELVRTSPFPFTSFSRPDTVPEYTCYPSAFFSSSSSLSGSETAMSTSALGMELCSHITLISFS